jgi:F-type H+-transporting ATPase subunit b
VILCPLWGAENHGEESGHGGGSGELIWKSVNFVLLAAGLGYLLYRKGGPYFRSRAESIRRDIEEANRLRERAEQQAVEIERRLAGLEADIEAMRRRAAGEMAAENERLRQETEAALEKIRQQAEQEIAGAAKAARQEVRAYAAGLAAELAAGKIRAALNEDLDGALVAGFLQELERSWGGAKEEKN